MANITFQKQVLLDQRQHVLEQFRQAVEKWSSIKQVMAENILATQQAFDEKETSTCSLKKPDDSLELDLIIQQLNFQRAWLDIKIKNLEISEGRSVLGPNDQVQVQQRALETQFLKEFPILGKKFFRKLKKLLKKNKMTVQSHHDFGARQENGLPKPRLSSLKKSVREPNKTETPLRTPRQVIAHIQQHPMVDRLKNANGELKYIEN